MAEFVQYGPLAWLADLILRNGRRLGASAGWPVCDQESYGKGRAARMLSLSENRRIEKQASRVEPAGEPKLEIGRICGISSVQLYLKRGSRPDASLLVMTASAAMAQLIHRTESSTGVMDGLPLLILAEGALIFSTLADYTTPLIRRIVLIGKSRLTASTLESMWREIQQQLQHRWPQIQYETAPKIDRKIGSRVRYCGEGGWTCLIVELLLGHQQFWFCQAVARRWLIASDSSRLTWPRLDWPRPEARQPQGPLPLTYLSQRYCSQFSSGKQLKQRFFHS